MARDAEMEQRLQRWAEALLVGDGTGFPSISTVHPDWSPPAPGQRPAMKVHGGSDVHATHRAVAVLPLRLRNTVVMYYVMKLPLGEQAVRLECAERTVLERIERAHRLLRGSFCSMREVG